jgi:hypothetical protein
MRVGAGGVLAALGALVLACPAHAGLGVGDPVQSIETNSIYQPESDAAIAPDGTVVFAYRDDDESAEGEGSLTLLQLSPDGTRKELVLAEDRYASPSVVVDDEGITTVVWDQRDGLSETADPLRFARVSPAGVVTAEGVVDVGVHMNDEPALGVAPSGVVTVAWQTLKEPEEDFEDRLFVAQIQPSGEVSAPTSLGIQRRFAGPVVAVDSEGDAIVLREFVPGERGRCQVNALQATGAVVRGPVFNCAYEEGRLAVGEDGTVTAVTRSFKRGVARGRIMQFADDTLRRRSRVMTGSLLSLPDVAVNPATGRVTLTWTATNARHVSRIVAARLTRSGRELGPISVLARDTRGPRLAFDSRGRALVLWRQLDGARLTRAGRVDAEVEGPPPTAEDQTRYVHEILVGPDSRPTIVYRESSYLGGDGLRYFLRLARGAGDWATLRR